MSPNDARVLIVVDRDDLLAQQLDREPELSDTRVLWVPTVRTARWLARNFRDAILVVGAPDQTDPGEQAADQLRRTLPNHTVCEYVPTSSQTDVIIDITVDPSEPNLSGTAAKLVSLLSVRLSTRHLRRSMSHLLGVDDPSETARPDLPA